MNRPPLQVQQIEHVVLRVRDAATMEAFYGDVLGCRVERRRDDIGLRDPEGNTTELKGSPGQVTA